MTRLSTLGAVIVVVAGCSRDDDVRVRLSRMNGPAPARIENVTVFVGANKSSWPELAPGEVVSVVLNPDGEPPQLTLTFTLDTEQRSWQGPPLAQGAGYVSDIVIDDQGVVTEQHCRTPCEAGRRAEAVVVVALSTRQRPLLQELARAARHDMQ